MISNVSIVVILFTASAITASDSLPPPGSFGFNWLDAASHCRKLTAKDMAQFSTCTVSTNAFGLESTAHVCKVDADTEYLVYETAAQCQEAVETMQSNGP